MRGGFATIAEKSSIHKLQIELCTGIKWAAPIVKENAVGTILMPNKNDGFDKKISLRLQRDFLAGALGIEPRTRGFGDRCSTS